MDKIISSPLTYWGGKRWLVRRILELVPDNTTEVFSPFLGGGSIEINLAYRGYKVFAYDNYQPLINFWQHWLKDPESVRLAVYELLSLYTNDDLNRLRYDNTWMPDLQSAAFYLIQNKSVFNGKMFNRLKQAYLNSEGDYIFRPYETRRYRLFQNFGFWQSKPLLTLNVQQAVFEQVFWIHQHQFAYIDSPYFEKEKEYGGSRENGFDHNLLRELVANRPKTILSYGDDPRVWELYDGFHIQRIKRGSDGRYELLILSPDITEKQLYLFGDGTCH